MWTTLIEELKSNRGLRVGIRKETIPVPYDLVLDLWQQDEAFRSFFLSFLKCIPFRAYRWETPAVTTTTANRPFEFVVTDSPELTDTPDPTAFAEHFAANPSEDVIAFPNLGNDAVLVVPRPKGPVSVYGHLAAFVREAPEAQQHSLWKIVGATMARRVGKKPVWLSTAGAGVAWLHVRLDDRPKYYSHGPYR
jgi:hypothetical protein